MRYHTRVAALLICVLALSGCAAASTDDAAKPAGDGLHSIAPDVVGQPLEEAKATLRDAGYVVGDVTFSASEDASPNVVISQDPVAGTSVPRGGTITLQATAGPASVEVPNVVGMTVSAAEIALGEVGLTSETPDLGGADPLAAKVVKQDPGAGGEAIPGTEIFLFTK